MLDRVKTIFLAGLLLTASCDGIGPGEVKDDDPSVLGSTDEFQSGKDLQGPAAELPGFALFEENCAECHRGAVPKAPHQSWLEMMSPSAIVAALNEGVMRDQAAHLDAAEKIHIAEFLTRVRYVEGATASHGAPVCSGPSAAFDRTRAPAAVNWGHDTDRFVPARAAGLSADDIPRLKLKWAFAYPGALRARSQPAVGMGAIYSGSHDGTVYAFDLESGCVRWTFKASAEVRTAVVLETWQSEAPEVPLAFFGDIIANLYAVNALTGELVWSIRADDHPSATLTGTPAYWKGRLYVPVSSLEVIAAADPAYECCTFRGKVMALEARSGEMVWESYSIPESPGEVGVTSAGTRVLSPTGAPVWSSPAIDGARNAVYFGSGENYSSPADGNSDAIIAVDIDSGERLWHRQFTKDDAWNVACMMADNPNCPKEDGPDFDFGSSMIVVDRPSGGSILVAGHKNGTIFGIDADRQGEVLWSTRVGRGSIQGGVHFGMAAEGARVYAPINDMNDTHNGDVLDPGKARPGVHAIDAETGERLWSHVQEDICTDERPFCDPGISAALTAIPSVVFAGHLDGYVRAYNGETGKVLWQFDTARDIMTISGATGRGGSMSGGGPVVADGHLIVNSGYGLYFHEPGNLLLVFSADGK